MASYLVYILAACTIIFASLFVVFTILYSKEKGCCDAALAKCPQVFNPQKPGVCKSGASCPRALVFAPH
jgi:hypothetical protein